jgi:hypothetical protein
MGELRNRVYFWCLELIEEGKIIQAIILMLATWNFAHFRYHMKDFRIREFEDTINDCDFSYFRDLRFEQIDFNNAEIRQKIQSIYDTLSEYDGVSHVGSTKIMHIICPNMFVMWDTKIRRHYKCEKSSNEYLRFLIEMQNKYNNNEFEGLDDDVTIPRAIDLYNMEHFSSS